MSPTSGGLLSPQSNKEEAPRTMQDVLKMMQNNVKSEMAEKAR